MGDKNVGRIYVGWYRRFDSGRPLVALTPNGLPPVAAARLRLICCSAAWTFAAAALPLLAPCGQPDGWLSQAARIAAFGWSVQDLMGHSDVRATEIYTKPARAMRGEITSPLDDL
jgi:hypothetical protein